MEDKITMEVNRVREWMAENKINSQIIERNCTVLPSDYKLGMEYSKIQDDLRFAPGMVRFEYKEWGGIIRRVEGFVCSVENRDAYDCTVKLWTPKNEMINLRLSCALGVNVIELPLNYKAKLENSDDF